MPSTSRNSKNRRRLSSEMIKSASSKQKKELSEVSF